MFSTETVCLVSALEKKQLEYANPMFDVTVLNNIFMNRFCLLVDAVNLVYCLFTTILIDES